MVSKSRFYIQWWATARSTELIAVRILCKESKIEFSIASVFQRCYHYSCLLNYSNVRKPKLRYSSQSGFVFSSSKCEWNLSSRFPKFARIPGLPESSIILCKARIQKPKRIVTRPDSYMSILRIYSTYEIQVMLLDDGIVIPNKIKSVLKYDTCDLGFTNDLSNYGTILICPI